MFVPKKKTILKLNRFEYLSCFKLSFLFLTARCLDGQKTRLDGMVDGKTLFPIDAHLRWDALVLPGAAEPPG